MESKSRSTKSGDSMSKKRNDGSSAVDQKKVSKTDGSSTPMGRRNGMKPTGEGSGSSAISTKPHGKGVVSDEIGADIMLFANVTLGPHEAKLRFRLIHFWEAQNPHTKVLIGEEMLLIDEKGTVIQGFISSGRVAAYLPHLKAGCVYKMKNFFGSKSKENYRVADPNVTVTFSWNSVLTLIKDDLVPFPVNRFRFHNHDEFQVKCDMKGDLYDFIGHIKLVERQSMADCPKLDEVDILAKRHVLVHVQTQDDPVMKMYIWDHDALDFCQKFKSYGSTPGVVLVTTVNPKRLGGTLSLSTMSSSRVFMDTDVQDTMDYLGWLSSNLDIANRVNAEVVTKPKTVTISELFAYIKQDTAKVAWFECTTTIDDVFCSSTWYYISCAGCHSKATKGASSLMCTNKKCEKSEVIGVPEYMTKVSVYDKSEQAMFVILGEAGRELTGKHASELVANYFEGNTEVEVDGVVPIPQALMDTIGQTHRFIVKVSEYNLTGKIQTITVTKVLPLEPPQNRIEDAAYEKDEEVSGSFASKEAKSG